MGQRRFELSDEQFERIEPHLPEVSGRGRPYQDHRPMVNGIFWILRTGAEDGTLERILRELRQDLDLKGEID